MAEMLPVMVTRKRAAELLGISDRKMWDLTAGTGRIRCRELNGVVMVPYDALIAFRDSLPEYAPRKMPNRAKRAKARRRA